MRIYKFLLIAGVLMLACINTPAFSEARTVINLNGQWSFEQTEKAFPPKKFKRTIPVPGLIHLAEPRISQYDKFFRTDVEVENVGSFNFLERDYTPMYNWYYRKVRIARDIEGKKVILNILKSQYVTTVYVNGFFAGRAIECYTPIKINITDYLRFGEENEILIMVSDRAWLPSECAGSTDKEKVNYLPGIWDDVFLTITGNLCVDKALFLPSLKNKKVTVKAMINNMNPPQMLYGAPTSDECALNIKLKEKKSGKVVATQSVSGVSIRDNRTVFETEMGIPSPKAWSPESPFLYEGEIEVVCNGVVTDSYRDSFGMRDFEVKGKFFYLNGSKYYLRGSNITLQRFFEDPECSNLPWDKNWVRKMLIENPKSIDWNAMRICVGIVPDFWYDLCDEYGIVLQNEWFYWQKHGWNEQICKEYTEWVWSDGNHPSIVIWDAINENWDDYIGNGLIEKLKSIDPTRVWDAGYMTSASQDEIDEPHTYRALTIMNSDELNQYFAKHPYNLGKLDNWDGYRYVLDAGVPQLINEYGWIWLWRDGRPSKLTVNNFSYYVGDNATPEQRRELQAYWLQMETEWLRSERGVAGVLAFCTLTNNYGFTGDWYIDRIKDLKMGPTYKWFRHCFAPEAVFIDLVESRYSKHVQPFTPGQLIPINLVGINDLAKESEGRLVINFYNDSGKAVCSQEQKITIPSFGKLNIPVVLSAPATPGGYLITAEYTPEGKDKAYVSRRFVKVGKSEDYRYFEIQP